MAWARIWAWSCGATVLAAVVSVMVWFEVFEEGAKFLVIVPQAYRRSEDLGQQPVNALLPRRHDQAKGLLQLVRAKP